MTLVKGLNWRADMFQYRIGIPLCVICGEHALESWTLSGIQRHAFSSDSSMCLVLCWNYYYNIELKWLLKSLSSELNNLNDEVLFLIKLYFITNSINDGWSLQMSPSTNDYLHGQSFVLLCIVLSKILFSSTYFYIFPRNTEKI